ncbi:hypothetical protein [Escherichia coli]|uniref:hypothetical protein n=1 Tax=Escherichia coli TaxID=562 RepID=UPI0013652584|nr:hypothetical protein [Escherichia coli]MWT70744.1 hypothetical protein [Escherichia coli]
MRKKIEMSLIKSPLNGVVIKRKIADGLNEIVSLKDTILLEATARIQSIEEKREEKFIQGYYDGYTKGIIDVIDNFIPLINMLSSELEKNRLNMINDLKSILLKSSEEIVVFIEVFEGWLTKLPSLPGPINLYIPIGLKNEFFQAEAQFFDRSKWEIKIEYHDDSRFVFCTEHFIAEFNPHEFTEKCADYLANSNLFSQEKINEISEYAQNYLRERICEKNSVNIEDFDVLNSN